MTAVPEAGLEQLETGRWRLSGAVNQRSVPDLFERMARTSMGQRLTLDLSGVTQIDSAALALLVNLSGRLATAGGTLALEGTPPALVALAEVSGVQGLLGLRDT